VDKGTLIEFRVQGERHLAVAERPEGKKNWIFTDERGQSHSLRPQRIEYQVPGSGYKASDIPNFLAEIQSYLDPSSLEIAWELLVEEGTGVAPADLAQLLFSEQTPLLCYAAHRLLAEDKIYFKKKAETYEPRSASQVAEIKHQLEVELQRQQEKNAFFSRVRLALAGETVVWQESDRPRLEALKKMVLYPERNHHGAEDILSVLERPKNERSAFELLVALGQWSIHENLDLLRASYPIHFPKKVLDVAQRYLESSHLDPDPNRLDLTHLKVYTIDDESTQEIDDGLSVEVLEDESEIRLWIHIADPTRLIALGDELELEARRRSTSLYLPTGTISMFPAELATGPMSLVQGRICPALSFGVVLDETGAVRDYRIHPTLIKPTYRLTYDDVDEMLELGVRAEPEIEQLAVAANLRQAWRSSQGSIDIRMPESSIKVKKDDEIAIAVLDDSRSRQLVAEMMILTGEVAGRYARHHNIPLPFRGQPQPELPTEEELLQFPPGLVRFCALRQRMSRSEMGITPSRHAGLGLEIYTQVTSPIRRYTDLLAHFQLKAHLRGDPLPFSAIELQELIYSVTESVREAIQVERRTNRYWSLEYLRRHGDRSWQGLVLGWVREEDNLGIILLEDLGLELRHRFHRSVTLGDRLEVQVSNIDPRQDVLHLRELLPSEAEPAASYP